MSDNIMYSCFEDLPNEIISDIFSYFTDPIHLLYSFYGLNERFDDLVSSCPIPKLLVVDKDELIDDCMEFFLPRACSLYLRIDWASSEQILTQFYPVERLVRLEQLRLSSRANVHSMLYELIFSNVFPSLKRCYLGSVESSSSWLGSPALSAISLALDDPETFECVLTACPNLMSLGIRGSWGITINNSHSPSYISQAYLAPPSEPNSPVYPNLRRLDVILKDRRDIYTDLDNILALVPNVERLVLLYGSLYDYNVLETFTMIVQRLPKLRRIDCDLSLSLSNHNISIINDIQQLHSSFDRLHIDQAFIFNFLRTYAESAPDAPFPFSTVFPEHCVGFTYEDNTFLPLTFDNR